MFKPAIIAVSLLMLSACNVTGLATTSYAPDSFQRMDGAKFSSLVSVTQGGAASTNGSAIPEGQTRYIGPTITYFWGTDGFISARKLPDGKVTYLFNVALQYQDDYIRRYDTVTDASGTKMKFKTISAREGNGGYKREYIGVTLTEVQMNEAKYDGLFLTFAAKEHERKVARSNRGRALSLGETLALVNEAQGGSNPEYKNNDNYELTVPARYVRNFLNVINNH